MDSEQLTALVAAALAEDVGDGDVTTQATVPADARARAIISQKAPGVIYGLAVAEAVFAQLDADAGFQREAPEGTWRQGGTVLEVRGATRALLTAERTALNFLAHLSGVATMSALAAQAVAGTRARILDTRKTIPGLRALEKAAVSAGGAHNHRIGLYDAILIKDNHIAAAGSIAAAVSAARHAAPALADTIEVEVSSPAEIDEALAAGAGRLLLDNMDTAQVRAAVAQVGGRAELEVSGGVTVERLPELASTGVDWISMGALTHSAPSLDLSMSLQSTP
jgi:nicotinate-nucleotide pyrophosphorylase (carboxylating)